MLLTLPQTQAVQNLSTLQLNHIPRLQTYLDEQRVHILLANGSVQPLLDIYKEELTTLLTDASRVDASWLHCSTSGIYFRSRDEFLPLVLCDSAAPLNVPPLRRQTTTDAADTSSMPSSPAPTPRTGTSSDVPGASESMHVLIDQSSSMASMNDAAFAGARELVESLPEDANVTISTFASSVSIGIQMARNDALRTLQTRTAQGQTALYDAIVQAVEAEMTRPASTVTIVVITDGCDNVSTNTTTSARAAVERFQARNGCRLLFLGSNQDAVLSAAALGIPVGRALTYGADSDTQMRSAFRAASENTRSYRTTRQDSFTSVQRQASVAR